MIFSQVSQERTIHVARDVRIRADVLASGCHVEMIWPEIQILSDFGICDSMPKAKET